MTYPDNDHDYSDVVEQRPDEDNPLGPGIKLSWSQCRVCREIDPDSEKPEEATDEFNKPSPEVKRANMIEATKAKLARLEGVGGAA